MSVHDAITRYLTELQAALPPNPALRDRVLAETKDHLEEAAASFGSESVSEDEAIAQAIASFGSAEEVAARFTAESRTRRPLASLSWALAALMLLGLGGYGIFEYSGQPEAHQAAPVQNPFTATTVGKMFDEGGVGRATTTTVEAFRSDGSRSSRSDMHYSQPGQTLRPFTINTIVDRSTDRYAQFTSEHGLISSYPLPRGRKGGYQNPFHTTRPKMCSVLVSALESDPTTERSKILGFDVLFHDYGDFYGDRPNGMFREVWVAPDLDCYELKGVARKGAADPTERAVVVSWEVISVAETDPSDVNFSIPSDLDEVPPSTIWTVAQNIAGSTMRAFTWSETVRARADKRYREFRAAR